MVDLVTRRLHAHLDAIKSQLTYIGDAISRGEIDFDNREQWSAFAVGTLAAVPQAVTFVVLPVDGQPSTFARADRRMLPERRENIPGADQLLERARTMEGPGWGKPMWSDVLGETILPIIVPIRVHGEFRGLVGAAIRATDLSRFLVALQLPDERTPFILFDHDKVLAHPSLRSPRALPCNVPADGPPPWRRSRTRCWRRYGHPTNGKSTGPTTGYLSRRTGTGSTTTASAGFIARSAITRPPI